jgi:hypothetical protein
MIFRLRERFELSIEAQVFYHYGYTSSELDTVILSWKEKINYDLVRPTSLVRKRGLFFTFRVVVVVVSVGSPYYDSFMQY